jgi:nitric oxide reductase subunit C
MSYLKHGHLSTFKTYFQLQLMSTDTKKYFVVIAILIALFLVYNYIIYTSEGYTAKVELSPKAMEGQLLWQKNNCWSCHQLYGLGGYLGPDLTNVYSHPDKGPVYINAFLNSGVKTMPLFNFSEAEKDAIIEYLRVVDKTGYYPIFDASIEPSGWVTIKYKYEE